MTTDKARTKPYTFVLSADTVHAIEHIAHVCDMDFAQYVSEEIECIDVDNMPETLHPPCNLRYAYTFDVPVRMCGFIDSLDVIDRYALIPYLVSQRLQKYYTDDRGRFYCLCGCGFEVPVTCDNGGPLVYTPGHAPSIDKSDVLTPAIRSFLDTVEGNVSYEYTPVETGLPPVHNKRLLRIGVLYQLAPTLLRIDPNVLRLFAGYAYLPCVSMNRRKKPVDLVPVSAYRVLQYLDTTPQESYTYEEVGAAILSVSEGRVHASIRELVKRGYVNKLHKSAFVPVWKKIDRYGV